MPKIAIALLLSYAIAIFSFSLVAASTKHEVDIPAADGIKLKGTYYEPGSRRGPALLLFHQCSRSRAVWTPLATKLAARGLRVVTVEPRGIGERQGEQWD